MQVHLDNLQKNDTICKTVNRSNNKNFTYLQFVSKGNRNSSNIKYRKLTSTIVREILRIVLGFQMH